MICQNKQESEVRTNYQSLLKDKNAKLGNV